MKRIIPIITFLSIFSLSACEQIDILPIEGSIEGMITDNNGVPLTGVQITAAFEAPSESGQVFQETRTTTTDTEGHYRLIELWDEVSLNIEHLGFQPAFRQVDLGKKYNPKVDIMLEGSPSILAIVPNTTTLSANTQDTLIVDIEISDTYNSGESFYEVNLLLQNEAGVTQAIIPAIPRFAGKERFLFEALVITADLQLSSGSYTLIVEVLDPDRNMHQKQAEEGISIE